MRVALYCLSLLWCCCICSSVFSQDTKTLTQSLETIFKDVRSGEKKVLIDECIATWTSSFLPENEKDSIRVIFQDMQTLRLSPVAELRDFAECVNAFCKKQEKENLDVWLTGIKKALNAPDKKRTVVKRYLESTRKLACDDLLFAGTSHRWYIKGQARWVWGTPLRIDYTEAEVVCKTAKDSICIVSTEGVYFLESNKWGGRGGCVYWSDVDSLKADLARYTIDLNMSEYAADSVLFHCEAKYGRPILGKLKDNASKYARNKKAEYPYFMSYATDIVIDSLFPYASYRGGIIYAGEKFSGYGPGENPAYVHIQPNDTLNMYVYSERFTIDTSRVLAATSRIVLDMDSGQLFHPNVNFVYMDKNRTVTVKRLTEQSLHVPFRDDFHKILFSVEQIIWPIDSSYMEMSMNSRSGLFKAQVESLNFFNDRIYDNLQGLDEVHPLNGLHKAAIELETNTFSIREYAGIMKKPEDQLRKELISLSYRDFLDYNEKKDEVTLKPRLFAYTEARVGKRDYDNIRFDSHPKNGRINAVLDLRNFNLKIYGVEKFTISETKDIYVEPSDKTVVMMKNRDMEFSGKLKAGMFDMYGTNLFFSYDRYTVDLTHVDSTGMYLTDRMTRKRGERINSLIRDVTGDIVIDKPDNKSGRKENPDFPVFNSTKDSYVYFDDPEIQNGVYKQDSFYFVIRPYTLKNINDAGKFRYAFSGTMVSHIVPDINDTLVLMKGNALGMEYETPGNGLKLYGEGNLKSRITMSQNGFRADGAVTMNGTDFKSSDILMTPDSMMTATKQITVDSVADRRPGAVGKEVQIKYLRKDKNLMATSTTLPFSVYNDRIKHAGTLFVYQDRMNASGTIEMKDASLSSTLFHLQDHNILSEHTDLQLSSLGNKNIQLNTANVKANIDLALNKGKFMNNEDANKADFPSNKYECSFRSFVWYMDEAYLNIGIEDEKELHRIWQIDDEKRIPDQGKNIFVSTDKACDSLTFIAPLAKYNLATGEIQCFWVNHIDLANGRFFPDEGKIFIGSLGDIQEFKQGRFLCELTDRTKTLTNVDLKLKGRYTFDGSGDFDYINQDRKRNVIRFTEIKADTSGFIYAKVNIPDNAFFDLNEGIVYKGNITMFSREKHLFFNGYVGLITDDSFLKHNWLKVKTYFAANDIRIPVQVENRNDKDARIYNGIFLNVDKVVKPYAAFQSNRIFYNDELIIGGQGEMVWSKHDKKYIIRDTFIGKDYRMCYDPATATVSAFGRLNIALEAPGIYQNAAGQIRYNLREEQLNIDNALYIINFPMLGKMEAVLQRDLTDKKLKGIQISPALRSKLTAVFGRKEMALLNKQLDRSGNNIPDSLNQTFVLDSLSLSWDARKRSYVANGKVMVLSFMKKPVGKEMKIKMELIRRRTGNEIYMYLYDDNMWYYFEYSDKSLYALSSSAEYNEIIKNEKADKKDIRDKDKQLLYTITLCPDSKKERFLKRIGEGGL